MTFLLTRALNVKQIEAEINSEQVKEDQRKRGEGGREEGERETDRQTDRQTETVTVTETETEEDREADRDRDTDTNTDGLFIQAIAPHEVVQVDDLPPHSTYYNYAYEQENQQTNDNVLD